MGQVAHEGRNGVGQYRIDESNGKMSALQTAAKDMVDSLSAFSKTTGDVYISIIPFATIRPDSPPPP